jgi:hypothetical protein
VVRAFPSCEARTPRSWCVRSVRELRHGDEAVGGTELDAVIVRAEVLDVAEVVSREQHTELFTLPTAHDELIVADALIAPPDKFVALRYQQESVFSIELGDTCEGQLPRNGLT